MKLLTTLLPNLSKVPPQVSLTIIGACLIVASISTLRPVNAESRGILQILSDAYNDVAERDRDKPTQRLQLYVTTQQDQDAAAQARMDRIDQRALAAISQPLSRRERLLLNDLQYPQRVSSIVRKVGQPDSMNGNDMVYGSVRLYVAGEQVTGAFRQ